ncbi:MAG: DegT/DnrJ/EryC1/StrS family aminotransferase [Desulfovibrionaceae bacterium]
MRRIPLIKPVITEALKDRVCRVLDSGYLTEGPVTREFERRVADYVGASHALAVTSCTTGLELALRAVGVGPGHEVVVPDYTYPATADVAMLLGATCVIVDVDPQTMLMDWEALEAAITPRTRVVMPVSIFGNPVDADRLAALKARHGFLTVEDAACSLGAEFGGRRVGALADLTVFSFHPRKFITTGEGGMVLTDNAEWAAWMESFKHFGMGASPTREGACFLRVGTNYKLSNVLAAIGLAQLDMADELLVERRALAARYDELLAGVPDVVLPRTTPNGRHSYQSYIVFVPGRDRVLRSMREKGVEVQIGTYSLHMHEAFRPGPLCRVQGDMAGSRSAYEHALALPLYHGMTAEEQAYVVDMLAGELAD